MARRESGPPNGGRSPGPGPDTSPDTTLLDVEVARHPNESDVVAGGDIPHSPDMEIRVAKLETHMEYMRRDLDEIKAGNRSVLEKLDTINAALITSRAEIATTTYDVTQRFSDAQSLIMHSLTDLPKKRDLHIYALIALAISLTVMAIVIGGIFGGLSWLKDY
jgi:hypothetical protein